MLIHVSLIEFLINSTQFRSQFSVVNDSSFYTVTRYNRAPLDTIATKLPNQSAYLLSISIS